MIDFFTSIKDLGWSHMITFWGYQWCTILPLGYQRCANDEIIDPPSFVLFEIMDQPSPIDVPSPFDTYLSSERQVKWDPIKYELSNVIELSNNIDENIWIDHRFPLAFDYFTNDDDILEYLGEIFELPKSNEKHHAPYLVNAYAYFGQEVNFHDEL